MVDKLKKIVFYESEIDELELIMEEEYKKNKDSNRKERLRNIITELKRSRIR